MDNTICEKSILHIPITVQESEIEEKALEIVSIVKKSWNKNIVELKLLTDGITNKLVKCKVENEKDENESILVRIYGNKTDLLIDRKAEKRNIVLLHSVGLAPKIYATFDNGFVYQFIPGCTLTDTTVTLPKIYRLIAAKMAQLHKVKVIGEGHSSPEPVMWTKTAQFLNLVPEVFTDPIKQKRFLEGNLPKSKIKQEVQLLQKELQKLNSPVFFTHNDLLLGNVIYNEDTNQISFIDFEYAALNYQAFDIANHFAEFTGIDKIDYNKYPKKVLQHDWIRAYLLELNGIEPSDKEINNLYIQVNKFVLISHVFWGIWALIQAEHSFIDFDFMEYAFIRFNEYFRIKDASLNL